MTIRYEVPSIVGSYLSEALVLLRESKYMIVPPQGMKLKKNDPLPFGTKIYVNSSIYKETSFANKQLTLGRVNAYNRGLLGENEGCKSLEEYQDKYMSLQCIEKIQRDHSARGLFSMWDCDCKQYVYEKQCGCSVLARHLDSADDLVIDDLLQELPANKKPGRPSKESKAQEKRKTNPGVVQGEHDATYSRIECVYNSTWC